MMSWRRLSLAGGVLLIALLDSSRASAFCRSTTCLPKKEACATDEPTGCVTSGIPVHWGTSVLAFRFHQRGSSQLVREEARAAVRAAFHRWSDVVCPDGRRTSLRFVEGEDILEDKPLKAGERAVDAYGVFFRDLGWPYDDVDETLAKTNTFISKKTGRIEYGDIEVNTTKRFAVTDTAEATDLQAVMTHEVGHYIGLAHSRVPQSIMAESYCTRDDRCEKGRVAARRLSEDDIAAVCAVYPPDGVAGDDPREKDSGSCATTPPAKMPAPFAAIGALVVAAAIARRRLTRTK